MICRSASCAGLVRAIRSGCVAALVGIAVAACTDGGPRALSTQTEGSSITGIRYLAGDPQDDRDAAFERALEPRPFEFPRDHGSHESFRTEWWYFTGNLVGTSERHYGFELTFFRIALAAGGSDRPSAWASESIWMAHFAVTDSARGRFHAYERLSRGGRIGLAGAETRPLRVWVEDWLVEASEDGVLELRARDADAMIDLRLEGFDHIVAQGDRGLDAKGPEPGNASYYYSAPRLSATGRVGAGAGEAVEGLAWMDREWSTSALSPGVDGWDWFALQLDDGRDLMFYRLRQADGTTSPFSGGSLSRRGGESVRLDADDVVLDVIDRWRSPSSGVLYPVTWRISIPEQELELVIEPRLPNQELELSVRYWEGAVQVRGTAADVAIGGSGYLELAGY